MQKLIMWNLVTLDGCFEGASSPAPLPEEASATR
jgi:hypothetical protein